MSNKKNKGARSIIYLLLRYAFLLIITLFIFKQSYNFLFALTIYPLKLLLSIFYNTTIYHSFLVIGSYFIEIIPACIALSAYVLLFILNLTMAMPIKKRIYSLVFSFLLLLIINIMRIFTFSILFVNNFIYFEQLHKFFWYVLSILIVILIWFLTVKVFKLKNIPIYSDFKFLYSQIKY